MPAFVDLVPFIYCCGVVSDYYLLLIDNPVPLCVVIVILNDITVTIVIVNIVYRRPRYWCELPGPYPI